MDNVKCTGREARLVDCLHTPHDDCGPGEGAGVICDTRPYGVLLNESCYELDVSYDVGNSVSIGESNTTLDCQALCLASNNCSHFTFYLDIGR